MNRKSIIWITLESIRLDHTTFGGHDRVTTPKLKQVASNAFASTQCFSHAIWTRPSTASILTGEAPSAHQTWSTGAELPDEIKTIPEAFSESGYSTVGISTTPHISEETSLNRGFDDFHYINRSTIRREVNTTDLIKYFANIRRHSGGFTTDLKQHSFGYLINSVAKNQIKKKAQSGSELFLYVHQPDTHHPFVPPVKWRDRFRDELPLPMDDAIELTLDISANLSENISADNRFTEKELETLRILYDTSIAYVDHLVSELVEYAKQHLPDPIIVVTSDHGEQLGERGLLAHVLVPDTSVTNVPLVVDGLSDLEYNGLIQPADVMKMITLDQNVDHPVRIGQDVRETERKYAVTQRGDERAGRLLGVYSELNEHFPVEDFHQDVLTSVRSKSWRYQMSSESEKLYELPNELTDVCADYPDICGNFGTYASEWVEDYGIPIGSVGSSEFNEEMEQQLKDMGYLT